MNLCSYVFDDPLNFIDPAGENAISVRQTSQTNLTKRFRDVRETPTSPIIKNFKRKEKHVSLSRVDRPKTQSRFRTNVIEVKR